MALHFRDLTANSSRVAVKNLRINDICSKCFNTNSNIMKMKSVCSKRFKTKYKYNEIKQPVTGAYFSIVLIHNACVVVFLQ